MNNLTLLMPRDLATLDRTFAQMQPDGSWAIPEWLVRLHAPYGTAPSTGFYTINWAAHGLTEKQHG